MKDVLLDMAEERIGDRAMKAFLLLAMAVNVAIIIGLTALWWTSRSIEFQPFNFPEQVVLNRLPGHGDVPAAYLGDPIVVRGTKCNTSSSTFGTHGSKSWSSVSPPGNTISTTSAGKAMKPGCKTRTFVNAVPPSVVMQMAALLKRRPYVVWQITGTLTAEHKDGSTRSWQTEPFYIYPKGTK